MSGYWKRPGSRSPGPALPTTAHLLPRRWRRLGQREALLCLSPVTRVSTGVGGELVSKLILLCLDSRGASLQQPWSVLPKPLARGFLTPSPVQAKPGPHFQKVVHPIQWGRLRWVCVGLSSSLALVLCERLPRRTGGCLCSCLCDTTASFLLPAR